MRGCKKVGKSMLFNSKSQKGYFPPKVLYFLKIVLYLSALEFQYARNSSSSGILIYWNSDMSDFWYVGIPIITIWWKFWYVRNSNVINSDMLEFHNVRILIILMCWKSSGLENSDILVEMPIIAIYHKFQHIRNSDVLETPIITIHQKFNMSERD